MRLVKVAVAIAVGCTVLAVSLPASAAPRRITRVAEAKIDAAAKEEVRSGRVAGAAVAVMRDGELVFANGYGRANLELAAPVNIKTVFRIGSLTKQFTAAGVLLLAEQGKLKIDDKLSLYLPNFPRANEVTLRDLLNHTSGIHNFTEGPVIDKISATGATVQVTIPSSASCVRQTPTVTLVSPSSQSAAAGQSLTYSVTVTNNDSAACPAQQFRYSGGQLLGDSTAGMFDNFTAVASPDVFTLAPGSSTNVAVSLTPIRCSKLR